VTRLGGLVLGKIDGSVTALPRSAAVPECIDYHAEAPPHFDLRLSYCHGWILDFCSFCSSRSEQLDEPQADEDRGAGRPRLYS
jgi:hypothetical protein